MTERLKFTVFRDSWARGGSSQLYTDGMRCCLGFLGLACGLTDEEMDGHGEPEELEGAWPAGIVAVSQDGDVDDEGQPHAWEKRDCTALCHDIIATNDEPGLSGDVRELQLSDLFAQANIQVEFKDAAE